MPPLTDLDPADFLRLVDRRRTNNALLTYRPGMVLPGQAFSRTTVATYFDANGIAQQAPINGLRDAHYIGGGTRTNLVIHSQFDSLAGYGGGPTGTTLNADRAPDGTLTAMTWTGAGRLFQEPASANATYTPSVYVRLVSGTATVQLVLKDNQTDTVRATVNATATSAWQRVVCPSGLTAAAAPGFRVEISVVGGVAPVIALWGLQVEAGAAVTGLIPTVAAPVTVFDGGTRTALLEGARTNSALWSRDLTNAAWTLNGVGSRTQNAVGLDGTANSATTLSDTDAAAIVQVFQSVAIPNDGATHAASVWFRKDTDQTRFPGFAFNLTGGTTGLFQEAYINTQTGAFVKSGSGTLRVIDAGLWWVLEATQTNNTTGNVTAALYVKPARATVIGTDNVAATGSCVIGQAQVELNSLFSSSPIFTAAGAVNRGADQLTFARTFSTLGPTTLFADAVNLGTFQMIGSTPLLAAIAFTAPRLWIYNGGGAQVYGLYHNGVSQFTASTPSAPALGDRVEACATVDGAGQMAISSALNGGSVVGPQAATANPPGGVTPGDTTITAGTLSASQGFAAFRSIKIAAGVRSLAAMRSL